MYGRKKSFFWGLALSALSWVYGAAVRIRRMLFALRILKREALACPVISVGNLTLGGTGKTPTVIQIADLLLRKGKHPVVVSRGYGRKNESEMLVVSDGRSMLVDSQIGGDEPVLIGSKLPGVPVVVGRNRFHAAQDALQRFHSDVVILDDGFQHIQLNRSLDIVLVDAGDPFGNGKLFPAGILREPLSELKRAHAVLITKAGLPNDAARLKEIISEKTRARIFTSRLVPLDIIDCCSGTSRSLSSLQGANVIALSGIARPASFTSLLKSLGASVAAEYIYPDHYVFQKSDFEAVYKKAIYAKVDMIITTEKDAVRLRSLNPEGIYALRVELSVHERDEWERMLLAQSA
jgi:tetraacyldisaccharide 4'-kinase